MEDCAICLNRHISRYFRDENVLLRETDIPQVGIMNAIVQPTGATISWTKYIKPIHCAGICDAACRLLVNNFFVEKIITDSQGQTFIL